MGGYKSHAPTIYVVQWPDGVVKVGYSEKQRWRKFGLLGASVLALHEFDSSTTAFAAETWGQEWLQENGDPAFHALEDSHLHVGPDGGGYRECYRLDSDSDVQGLLEHMLRFEVSNAR